MKKNFICTILIAILSVLGIATAHAQEDVKDYGELQLNVAYELPAFMNFKGYYNVTANGMMKITSSSSGVIPSAYMNEEHSQEYSSEFVSVGSTVYIQFAVKAGDVVHVGNGFNLMSAKFTLTFVEEGKTETMKLVTCLPVQNSKFDMANNAGQLSLVFNLPIATKGLAAKVYFNSKSYSATPIVSGSNSNQVRVVIEDAINELLDNGIAQGGETFEVRVTGIADANNSKNLYNSTGILRMNFIMPKRQPHIVKDEIATATLLSWFSPNKPEGVYSITFDQPIMPFANFDSTNVDAKGAYLSQGNIENGSEEEGTYYREPIAYTLSEDSCTLTIDFRGKQRNKASTLPNYEPNTEMGESEIKSFLLRINSLKGANGEYVQSPGSGTVGSLTYDLPWIDLSTNDAYQVLTDVTPTDGAEIKPGDEIEVWISNPENLEFNDITIGGVKAEYTIEDDPDEGVVYYVTVPEVGKSGEVKLEFTNLEYIDGIDHSADLNKTYMFKSDVPAAPVDGDINGDGVISIADITALISLYLSE